MTIRQKRRFLFYLIMVVVFGLLSSGRVTSGQSPYDKNRVNSLSWDSTGKVLAVGTNDGVWLYSTDLEKRAHVPTKLVTVLRWDSDTQLRVVSGPSGVIQTWDIASTTFQSEVTLEDYPTKTTLAPVWSTNGKELAMSDEFILIWNTDNGKLLHKIEANAGWAITWSPDGHFIAVNTMDKMSIQIWNADTATLVQKIANEVFSRDLAWSPDGKLIANVLFYSTTPSVEFWDVLQKQKTWTLQYTDYIQEIAWSSDSKYIAISGNNDSIDIYDMSNQKPVAILQGHKAELYRLIWSKNLLASYSDLDGTLRTWDTTSQQQIGLVQIHPPNIQ